MKRNILILISLFSAFLLFSDGCTVVSSSEDVEDTPRQVLTQTEQKRIDLYLAAMKAAFEEGNGGSQFIAVKLETLEGLSSEGKLAVMAGLKDLSPHVYDFEKIKDDTSKFNFDSQGSRVSAKNGTLLWVDVEEFNEDRAVIEATSWFGNLGAVFLKFDAQYVDNQWELKVIHHVVA